MASRSSLSSSMSRPSILGGAGMGTSTTRSSITAQSPIALTSFHCRRATRRDVPALESLVDQQRLMSVQYTDSHTDTTASLFAARAHANRVHLLSEWHTLDFATVIDTNALCMVVEDDSAVIAVAAFDREPHSAAAYRDYDYDWPDWLPSLTKSTMLDRWHTQNTAFLTFFACASLDNERQERRFCESVLRKVYATMKDVQHILRVPNVRAVTASEGGNSEESAATSLSRQGHRSSFVQASDSRGDAAPFCPPLHFAFKLVPSDHLHQCPPLFATQRTQFFPSVSIRRARLEDHDDLAPIVAKYRETDDKERAEQFFLAKIIEPRIEEKDPIGERESEPAMDSHPLVAELNGRALGLMHITGSVHLSQLSQQFVLGPYQLDTSAVIDIVTGPYLPPSKPLSHSISDSASDTLSDSGTRRTSHHRPADSLCIPSSDTTPILRSLASSPSHATSLTARTKLLANAQTHVRDTFVRLAALYESVDGNSAVDRAWVTHQLISFIQSHCAGDSPPAVSAVLKSLSGSKTCSSALFDSEFIELVMDVSASVSGIKTQTTSGAISPQHGHGHGTSGPTLVNPRVVNVSQTPAAPSNSNGTSFLFNSPVQRSGALVGNATPKQHSHSHPTALAQPLTTPSAENAALHVATIGAILQHLEQAAADLPAVTLCASTTTGVVSGAFAITLFCIDESVVDQSEEFLLPAFALFPDRDYCLLTLPHTIPPPPLLRHFTRVEPRVSSTSAEHALYIMHRHTATALRQHAVSVRLACKDDWATVTQWIESPAQSLTDTLQAMGAIPPHAPLSQCRQHRHVALTVECAGELVGLLALDRLRDTQQLEALHREFALEALTGCREPNRHALLSVGLLNPLFHALVPFVLRECLRLTGLAALHARGDSTESLSVMENDVNHALRVHGVKRLQRLVPSLVDRAMVEWLRPVQPTQAPTPPLPLPPSAALHFPSADAASAAIIVDSADTAVSNSGAGGKGEDSPPAGPVATMPVSEYLSGPSAARGLSFSLSGCTSASLCAAVPRVNDRIVLIGCSATALAAIERLVHNPHIQFESLTIIARAGLHSQHEDESGGPFLPHDLHFTDRELKKVGLKNRVKVIQDTVVGVTVDDGVQRVLCQRHPPVPFDQLLVATGRQPAVNDLVVRVATHDSVSVSVSDSGADTETDTSATVSGSLVSGLFPLSNAEHLPPVLDWHDDHCNTVSMQRGWLVYGATLTALTAIRGLLELGIPARFITWAHSASQEELSDRVVHGDSALLLKMIQVLTKWNVRLLHHVTIKHATATDTDSHHRAVARYQLRDVTFSTGEILPCVALLYCHDGEIGHHIYEALLSLGLVFDGDLIVDSAFRTHLPIIRAAGPMAKFKAALRVQFPYLRHALYDSHEVGREMANAVIDEFRDAPPSAPRLGVAPVVECAYLPGDLYYYHARDVRQRRRPPVHSLEQSLNHSTLALALSTSLTVHSIHYSGYYLIPARNFRQLVGLPVSYLNRLLQRWQAKQVKSLLLFLCQPWTSALYQPAFHQWRQELIASVESGHANQLAPITTKMQQYQSEFIANQSKGSDGATLTALSSFLPQQVKEHARRAVAEFVLDHQHRLPHATTSDTRIFHSLSA